MLDIERTSARLTNTKAGHELVVRGDDSHDAGGSEIKTHQRRLHQLKIVRNLMFMI